jgi:hypothetical protein
VITAALAFALQAVPVVTVPDEVVVTARRLKDWQGRASANEHGSRCRTTRSTGDKELDQIACDSMRWCITSLQAQAAGISQKGLPREVREQRTAALNSGMTACMEEQHTRRVTDLLDRRAAARIN